MSIADEARKGPPKTRARILTLDIECSPNRVDVWQLNAPSLRVGLNQVHEVSRVLCFAAKWHGSKKVLFFSEDEHGHEAMIEAAWNLFNEADVIVAHNATFDIKHLQREFLLAGMTPPSPFKTVCTLKAIRQNFRFASNKLDHVCQQLGLGNKVHHEGHELWTKVMAGDPKACAKMKRYCKADVVLCEALYDRLGAYISSHPHHGIYTGQGGACFRCGGTELIAEGIASTTTSTYARLKCVACGAWSRASRSLTTTSTRSAR